MLFKILACINILALIVINIRYKMQIKNIYRQVDFIKKIRPELQTQQD